MGTSEHDDFSEIDEETMVVLKESPLKLDMLTTIKVPESCVPPLICENCEIANPSKVVKETPSIPSIFLRDIVRSNEGGMLGLVTKFIGDSELVVDGDEKNQVEENTNDDGIDTGKVDVNANIDSLPVGQIEVLWMDNSNTIQNLNDVTLVDRELGPGFKVAATSDPTGQIGVVREANITVDLVATDGYVLKGVSDRDLVRVCNFTTGDFVVLGPWLGEVYELTYNVTVLFDDGSSCKVKKVDPDHFKQVGKIIHDFKRFPFYPGQRVRAFSSRVFKNASWISVSRKPNRVEGTITKVTVGSVFINWHVHPDCGPDSATPPAAEQGPKKLKLLPYYSSHPYWELGDWCFLPSSRSVSSPLKGRVVSEKVKRDDSMIRKIYSAHASSHFDYEPTTNEPFNHGESMDLKEGCPSTTASSCDSSLPVLKKDVNLNSHVPSRRRTCELEMMKEKNPRKKHKTFERAFFIFNTCRSIKVDWQNGVIDSEESTNLIPIDDEGCYHEFIPGQYVVEKNWDDACESKHVGVVSSVDAKEKTATLRWLKAVNGAEDPPEFDKEQVVSVYEIEEHPDHIYHYGDVVARVPPSSVLAEPDKKECISDCKKDDASVKKFSDLPRFGNITDMKNGDIEIIWADGMISKVRPHSIYAVAQCGGGFYDEECSTIESESWETSSEIDVIGNAMDVA